MTEVDVEDFEDYVVDWPLTVGDQADEDEEDEGETAKV
jgi:hypothetical protein